MHLHRNIISPMAWPDMFSSLDISNSVPFYKFSLPAVLRKRGNLGYSVLKCITRQSHALLFTFFNFLINPINAHVEQPN